LGRSAPRTRLDSWRIEKRPVDECLVQDDPVEEDKRNIARVVEIIIVDRLTVRERQCVQRAGHLQLVRAVGAYADDGAGASSTEGVTSVATGRARDAAIGRQHEARTD